MSFVDVFQLSDRGYAWICGHSVEGRYLDAYRVLTGFDSGPDFVVVRPHDSDEEYTHMRVKGLDIKIWRDGIVELNEAIVSPEQMLSTLERAAHVLH